MGTLRGGSALRDPASSHPLFFVPCIYSVILCRKKKKNRKGGKKPKKTQKNAWWSWSLGWFSRGFPLRAPTAVGFDDFFGGNVDEKRSGNEIGGDWKVGFPILELAESSKIPNLLLLLLGVSERCTAPSQAGSRAGISGVGFRERILCYWLVWGFWRGSAGCCSSLSLFPSPPICCCAGLESLKS